MITVGHCTNNITSVNKKQKTLYVLRRIGPNIQVDLNRHYYETELVNTIFQLACDSTQKLLTNLQSTFVHSLKLETVLFDFML